jgi:hypothetical protein
MAIDPSFITGAERVVERFGAWPSFHDAEVLHFELNRDPLWLELQLLTQHREPHMIVRLRFSDVDNLEVGGFNHQNALSLLYLSQGASGNIDVVLESAFGLGGSFRCKAISVVDVRLAAG